MHSTAAKTVLKQSLCMWTNPPGHAHTTPACWLVHALRSNKNRQGKGKGHGAEAMEYGHLGAGWSATISSVWDCMEVIVALKCLRCSPSPTAGSACRVSMVEYAGDTSSGWDGAGQTTGTVGGWSTRSANATTTCQRVSQGLSCPVHQSIMARVPVEKPRPCGHPKSISKDLEGDVMTSVACRLRHADVAGEPCQPLCKEPLP